MIIKEGTTFIHKFKETTDKNYLISLCDVWGVENKKYNITSHYFLPSFMITEHTSKMDDRLIDQMINSTK